MKTLVSFGLAAVALAAADAGGIGGASKPVPAPKAKAPEVAKSKYDDGLAIPAKTRGAVGGTSQLAEDLKNCPVGKSFLEEVTVPEGVKESEREAVFKELVRKRSNGVAGTIRRFKKANPGYNFETRTVNSDELGHGVRVWRVEDKTA